jgi:hypothetical protein
MKPSDGRMDGEQVARELLSRWDAVPIGSIALNDERVGGVLVDIRDERAGVILFMRFLLIVIASEVVSVFLCGASDRLSKIGIKKRVMRVSLCL